jgi:hypothetical protein
MIRFFVHSLLVLCASFTALTLGYLIFTGFAMQARPMNQDLAYDALVRELQSTLTGGKDKLRLAPVMMLQRPDEVIFVGQGTVNSSRQQRDPIPLLERLSFRYVVIVSRQCIKWDASCYKADELELTAEKNAVPMI